MSLLLDSTIKVSLILLFALGTMPLLRRRSAALRHWVLFAALACAASAPVVGLLVPSWHLPVRLTLGPPDAALQNDGAAAGTGAVPGGGVAGARAGQSDAPLRADGFSAGAVLPTFWIAGAVLGVAALLVGLARLARLTSRAQRITTGAWVERAEEIRLEYGLRRPLILLQSGHPTLLVTWGLVQPKVILPATAREWRADRVRVVLSHELAHVRRHDWIVQVVTELVRAVFWFNPLVWMACARLRQESEQACDDAVLNGGVEGPEYASHLVAIARDLQQRRMWMPAPAIARTSSLERRVRAMLDARLNRRPTSRLTGAAALFALLAVTIPIAGFAAAQTAFATVAGSVADPMNGLLPDVTLVLTNTQSKSKHEIRSDRAGRYEFVGVPPGDYLLEAKYPGFAVLQGTLTLTGVNVQQDLILQIGSVTETITVHAGGRAPDTGTHPAAHVEAARLREERRKAREAVGCNAASAPGSPRIGGNIRPPVKLVDVRPAYPPHLASTGVEGTVILRARIGIDGMVRELDVVRSPHADLAAAAADAVRLWEFDATLLNCVPVEVVMNVTVHFQHGH